MSLSKVTQLCRKYLGLSSSSSPQKWSLRSHVHNIYYDFLARGTYVVNTPTITPGYGWRPPRKPTACSCLSSFAGPFWTIHPSLTLAARSMSCFFPSLITEAWTGLCPVIGLLLVRDACRRQWREKRKASCIHRSHVPESPQEPLSPGPPAETFSSLAVFCLAVP